MMLRGGTGGCGSSSGGGSTTSSSSGSSTKLCFPSSEKIAVKAACELLMVSLQAIAPVVLPRLLLPEKCKRKKNGKGGGKRRG
mmetsp:Transcript_9350/g.15198  ORF Transcript_9350/g.15198 Transcript_9350/m.15198 type:complete len:83 (-) Transcript_9350:932-1180(-)